MTIEAKAAFVFDDLESRVRMLLPEMYQDCYHDVQPVSMGSAGLKYGEDGRVAWNEIWRSFCDLAMAGGPPHRGTLLEPGPAQEIESAREQYDAAVLEICRAITLVTGLLAEPSDVPGWVRVYCHTDAMAGWLARAIVTENVSARFDGHILSLPAGPAYTIEKEIKNVVTSLAKTCHYWVDHISPYQRQTIANLFLRMEMESPIVQPNAPGEDVDAENSEPGTDEIAKLPSQRRGMQILRHRYRGWVGLDCMQAGDAVRVMRFLMAGNVFSRREGTIVFVPKGSEGRLRDKRLPLTVEMANREREATQPLLLSESQ